jgi:hypothetical protein
MNLSSLVIPVSVGLILLVSPAPARSQAAKTKAAPDANVSKDKAAAKAQAESVREGRRARARSLLFSLSGEARAFRDQVLRTRSLAKIADALWDVAPDQGRTLFREAWDAATKAEEEGAQRLNLCREVLTLAAGNDRQLAEEFLQKLQADRPGNASAASGGDATAPPNSLWTLPEAAEKRLGLAKNLLAAGDVKRALEFADPVLGGVTISTMDFLTLLRGKDAPAADRRYAATLVNVLVSPLADANTISLLASYLFTPRMYVIFSTEGGADTAFMQTNLPPTQVEPQLRLAFFRTAAGVLLRPQPPPEQDRSSAGMVGKYMVMKRLMPLFERYAPPEVAQAVRGQFESLGAQLSDGVRESEDEWVRKGIAPERPPADQERSLLGEVERARTPDERDELYFRLALLSLAGDDAKVRDYVSRIEERSFRERAQAWVDWNLALKAVEKKRVETALELAGGGTLTRIQRVLLLTRAAKLLAQTDRERALSLLDDARSEARRIDRLDPDRPRGLLAVANAQRVVEPSRVWDSISDAVEAANSAEDFTGADGVLISSVNSKSQISKKTDSAPEFDVAGLFGEVAKSDLERATLLAGGFKGEAVRANAVIAIARAVLDEKAPAAASGRQAPKE